ncbi:MAG: 3-oxoacyl-[acyl-carrier-protein] reductase [Elusimicrobia bacterium]|nr:3-oxoacyl-[acyl-carrier-protein] reductase [Elusimicrobiota bacterium]
MSVEQQTKPATAGAKRLQDKVAIITGSALGIGRATAELFAREGAKVVIVDIDPAACEKASAEIRGSAGVETLGAAANVTDFAAVEAVVKAVIDRFGKIDILVNNAGITKDNLLMRLSEADWDAVLSVNLKGAFFFTKAVVRPMMKAHSGRIINISSVVGQEGNLGQSNYAASKGGLIALTKACAKEFASRNILVNAVAPGFVHTRLTDVVSEEAKKRTLERILLGRMAEPEEIAKVIAFLASDDSSYVTGQVIGVNGGMYI